MIDSGAELSLVNQDVVERRGLPAEPLESPLHIILADRSRVLASHYVPFPSAFPRIVVRLPLLLSLSHRCRDLCSSEEIGCSVGTQ